MAKRPKRKYEAAQSAAEAAATQAKTLSNNLRTDLTYSNAPDIQTNLTGGEDVMQVGGSSSKRRRASGALSSQLGINT